VRPAQKQTCFEVPFQVPAGTHRITVTFHNLGKDQRTVLDLGIIMLRESFHEGLRGCRW